MSVDIALAATELTHRLVPGDSERRLRGTGGVAETFAAVTAKRWRRSALSEYSARDTKAKITRAWEAGEPLTLTIPCGGYKSWRINSSPLPNWAEVFFVDYLRRYVREISAVYPHGVRAELTYVSGVMDMVSNHNPSWQEQYIDAMGRLLAHHSDEPKQLSFVDIASQPGVGDLRAGVLENFARMRAEWDGSLSAGQTSKLRSAERNFAPKGAVTIHPDEMNERILRSAILCDSLDALEARRSYNKFGPRIQLVFDRRPQPAVHIGTSETSTTHFWVSEGVLERNGSRFLPRMVGHTSLPVQGVGSVPLPDADEHRARIGTWLPKHCEVI